MLQTEENLKTWCNKYSREAGTKKQVKELNYLIMVDFMLVLSLLMTNKVDLINTMMCKLSETDFFTFYINHYITTMLAFFSIQYSKTECTVRSLGLTATRSIMSSSVQGVHHAGVAVELELLLLKNMKMVLVVISSLIFDFTTSHILIG